MSTISRVVVPVDLGDATTRLTQLITERDREQFHAEAVVKVGDPSCEIVNCARARGADLIIMGTHGRTGVAHFVLGNVAERVVRTAACPVMTIQ